MIFLRFTGIGGVKAGRADDDLPFRTWLEPVDCLRFFMAGEETGIGAGGGIACDALTPFVEVSTGTDDDLAVIGRFRELGGDTKASGVVDGGRAVPNGSFGKPLRDTARRTARVVLWKKSTYDEHLA